MSAASHVLHPQSKSSWSFRPGRRVSGLAVLPLLAPPCDKRMLATARKRELRQDRLVQNSMNIPAPVPLCAERECDAPQTMPGVEHHKAMCHAKNCTAAAPHRVITTTLCQGLFPAGGDSFAVGTRVIFRKLSETTCNLLMRKSGGSFSNAGAEPPYHPAKPRQTCAQQICGPTVWESMCCAMRQESQQHI